MKILLNVFSFISLLLIFSLPAEATNEFIAHYQVTFKANKDGRMHVTQNISLTNKLSDVYATSYSLTIEKKKPENISAFDALGPLKTTVNQEDEKTIIVLEFNDEVVGKGKTLNFTLSYEIPDLITKSGQVWEIVIPKLANPEMIDEYDLKLMVPLSFGQPAYISPAAHNQKTEGDFQNFFFKKNDLTASGIIAAFGEFQIFDFSLNYHLENTEEIETRQKIALPPDTAYQKVTYWQINPEPENVEVDDDGNWLAVFILRPQDKILVSVSGQAKIFAQPILEVPKKINFTEHLKEEKYWEVNEPEIQELAKRLKTPRAIHEFVVSTLEYDFSRARIGVKRLGAKLALKNPGRAICMEYTDLFIALARAAGIPAREINGFSYTTNSYLKPLGLVQDVLHSWPEFWDEEKKKWVQIDPTWQDTTGGINYFDKLDLGHFAFVIHGLKSDYPLPAGAYKTNSFAKDIQINFGSVRKVPKSSPSITFNLPEKIYSEEQTAGEIIIKNPGGETIYNLNLSVAGENLKVETAGAFSFDALPPFSTRKIKVFASPKQLFYRGASTLKVLSDEEEIGYDIYVDSLTIRYILPIFGGFLGATTLFIIARKVRRLSVQNKERGDPLHREGPQSSPAD